MPSKEEWEKAPLAPEVRVTDGGCTVKRIREWYRVESHDQHVSLVAGTREGVEMGHGREGYRASVTFPARRGDRRVFLFSYFFKWWLAEDAIVSEQWLEGDPAPLITVTGIPSR